MPTLILLRHGESAWNRENRFAGWTDVDLTKRGRAQAWDAGERLRDAGILPDTTFTSCLRRAIRTLWITLDAMDRMWLPVDRSWRLNERHYGALQGAGKAETTGRVGADQVHRWRRGFRARPPAIDRDSLDFPGCSPAYQHVSPDDLPLAESLEDTLKRLVPYWNGTIASALRRGETALVCAHGNSLRALLYHIDSHTPESIETVEIPIGIPLVYRLDDELRPIERDILSEGLDVSERRRSAGGATSNPLAVGEGIGGGPAMGREGPETLSEALARLDALGYREDLRGSPHGLKASPSQVVHPPESFVVDEVVRFEGESDPDDEALLFALRCSEDGLMGTYVVPYGPGITPMDAERVHALHKVVEQSKASR